MRNARHYWLAFVLMLMGSRPVVGVEEAELTIKLFQFQPGSVEVAVGSRITWTNADVTPGKAGN